MPEEFWLLVWLLAALAAPERGPRLSLPSLHLAKKENAKTISTELQQYLELSAMQSAHQNQLQIYDPQRK